jgi:hypothetical protein
VSPREVLRFAVLAVLTAAVVVAAVIGLLAIQGNSSGSDVPPAKATAEPVDAAPPLDRTAIAWMARELPHHAGVSAAKRDSGALRHAGFHPFAHAARYVIASAAPHGTVAIARFAANGAALVVAQHADIGNLAQQRQADQQRRNTLERSLLGNFRIHAGSQPRSVLYAGGLDYRAAEVLNLLAGSDPVTLLAIPGDPPEQAVGLPRRSVELRVPAAGSNAILETLPAADQPATVTNLKDGAQRWTWSLQPVPIAPQLP